MNVIFVSPQFPETYWHFCAGLRDQGVTTLGIGDTPFDQLSPEVKGALVEYYWVPNLEDYDQTYRAVAYFAHHYGKIDWLESNNEYWLSQDARLRTDFHITTGAGTEQMSRWQSKAEMKGLYAAGGVPTARQTRVTSLDEVRAFAAEVGYPVFAKPEVGVGSGGTARIDDEAALTSFVEGLDGSTPYVLEEYVTGDICSYEAILDSSGEPLFENQCEFPPSMADVVAQQLDVAYCARPTVDPKLQALGRAAAKGFGLKSRFVHMEFFRLTEAKAGLGGVGDYVGLEVNVRPPGGYTPDMLNYAHSNDVYRIWADMVVRDSTDLVDGERYWCVYAGRRDCHSYVHTHEDICRVYGDRLVMVGRVPDALSDDLCNQMYVARLRDEDEKAAFEEFVLTQA